MIFSVFCDTLHWEKNGFRIGSDRGNLTKLPKIGGSDFLGLVEHYVRMVIQRLLRLWLPDWGNSVRIVEIHAAAGVIGSRRISISIRPFPQPKSESPWSEWGQKNHHPFYFSISMWTYLSDGAAQLFHYWNVMDLRGLWLYVEIPFHSTTTEMILTL